MNCFLGKILRLTKWSLGGAYGLKVTTDLLVIEFLSAIAARHPYGVNPLRVHRLLFLSKLANHRGMA